MSYTAYQPPMNTVSRFGNALLVPPTSKDFHTFQLQKRSQKYQTDWNRYYKPFANLHSYFKKLISIVWIMYKTKLLAKIRYLRIVPGFLVIVAITVAAVNLWLNDAELILLLIAAGIVALSLLMLFVEYVYSPFEGLGPLLTCSWWGLLLGVVTFGTPHYRTWQFDDRDRLMDMLLMTSSALKCCCDFLDRFCEDIPYRSTFLLPSEATYLMGFLTGGFIFLSPKNDVVLFLIIIATSFVLVNLRMKCTLAFFYLFLFIAVAGITVFDNLNQKISPYALVCFYTRLLFPTILDFYFSPLSALERWSCSFELSRCRHYVMLLCFFIIEAAFGVLAVYVIRLHPEYELVFVIPVVTTAGILWVCTHLAFITTEVTLSRKLHECVDFYNKLPTTAAGTNLSHVMSSRGVRLLCFVGQQTVACALLATFLFGAVCWRREEAVYPSLLLVVLGLECASFGRIRELSVKLGGTCVSYALITPTTPANPTSTVTILPVDSLQKQNDRATSLITSMHRFFALYLIEILGCDYSTLGMGFTSVEEKIKNLFSKRTKEGNGDGARYDTYLFYFSGLTADDGSLILGESIKVIVVMRLLQGHNNSASFAAQLRASFEVELRLCGGGCSKSNISHQAVDLGKCRSRMKYNNPITTIPIGLLFKKDGAVLSPDQLINMWQESCCDEKTFTSSRLLLILDITRLDPWMKAVKILKRDYIAVQGCSIMGQPKKDVEEGLLMHNPGSFTSNWVQWNFDLTSGLVASSNAWPDDDSDETSSIKPTYVVSRRWTDFSLRVPSLDDDELTGHWIINYSIICRPCLALSATCARRLRLVRVLSAPGRRYRRLKMRWFPPTVLDTGHGFKLVRVK